MEEKKHEVKKKLALFDVAHTLVKKSVLAGFAEHLYEKELFKEEAIRRIRRIQELYKMQLIDHNAATRQWSRAFSHGVKGLLVKDVEKAGKEFATELFNKHMVGTLPLYLHSLRKLGYRIHLLSGAPEEVIKDIAKDLEADGHHALRLPKTPTGKRYTGGPPYHGYVMTSRTKEKLYVKKIKASYSKEDTIGVGDGLIDIDFLKRVAKDGDAILLTGARDRPDKKAEELANEVDIRIETDFGRAIEEHLGRRLKEIDVALESSKEPAKTKKLTEESAELKKQIPYVKIMSLLDRSKELSWRMDDINSKKEKKSEDLEEQNMIKQSLNRTRKLVEKISSELEEKDESNSKRGA